LKGIRLKPGIPRLRQDISISLSYVTAGANIDVCNFTVRTDDYPDLSKCKKAAVGDEEFSGLAVFTIK
jgi:hypothetical protein